jgi:GT2 family glycosyltransferase
MTDARLTVGITTRNRPQALDRCLRSLQAIAALSPEIIVFDDGSRPPVEEQLAGLDSALRPRIVRDDRAPGYITGRNRLVREASASRVLLLDDDAALLEGGSIERALELLDSDERVAAIAFAQADRNGRRWDDAMQPGRGRVPCYIPSFIGFAHLVRRDLFLQIGGYRESFAFYGEEKDFCLRLLDAGFRTVYLPDALVVHEPDGGGRSKQRYLRYVTRNDCLTALYNEPWRRLVWLLPARLGLYFRMRRAWNVDDPWGWAWIVGELVVGARSIWKDRRPVSLETIDCWKRLRRAPEPYVAPGTS